MSLPQNGYNDFFWYMDQKPVEKQEKMANQLRMLEVKKQMLRSKMMEKKRIEELRSESELRPISSTHPPIRIAHPRTPIIDQKCAFKIV